MDDLISRANALNIVKDVCEAILSGCGSHYDGEDEVYDDLREVDAVLKCNKEIRTALKHLPSAQQWIPCDKGEPDEDMECWVTVKTTDALYRGNFTKRYGERRDKGFITSGGFMWWNTALAWMPIYEPEPYRSEGDYKHERPDKQTGVV